MGFRFAYLHLTLPILKVKIKVMHILKVNIVKKVRDGVKITITVK